MADFFYELDVRNEDKGRIKDFKVEGTVYPHWGDERTIWEEILSSDLAFSGSHYLLAV